MMKFLSSILTLTILSLSLQTTWAFDIRDGLVSYWPLNADDGGTALDSGFGNHMTVNNSPTVVPGKFGNAFSFSGASQYLSVVHDTDNSINGLPIYTAAAGYTISFWVKGAPQAASRMLFSEGNNTVNTPVIFLETDPTANGDKFAVRIVNNAGGVPINNLRSATAVWDDNWHHIGWVDNKGSVALYVDGVLDTANFNYTAAGPTSLNLTTIGALARGTPINFFVGLIDDVAVWERPLSQGEIQSVMTNSIPTPISPAAPVFVVSPTPSTNTLGDRATFSAIAAGNRPLSYQWFRNGTLLDGQTNSTLAVTDLTESGTNDISVVASNPFGSETNTVALVIVPDPEPNVSAGLVSYWPFEVTTNSPATTPDLYSQNDMALVNMDGSNLAAGMFGNALVFDGIEEYSARVGGFPIYNNPTYTIAMWVKGDVFGQANRTVFAEGSSTTTTPLINFGTDAGGFIDNLSVLIRNDAIPGGAPVNNRKSTRSVFDNNWHHLVWTDDNGTARLYIDGVLDETDFSYTRGTLTLDTTAAGALVRTEVGNYFSGSMDDLAQWNRKLTWTEIQEIRTNSIPEPVAATPPSIVFQPTDLTNAVFAGDTVSFSVQAAGTGPLNFQWRRNDIDIPLLTNPTATSNILTLENVQPVDSSAFSVVITNSAGSITSSIVQLVVTPYTPATTGAVLSVDFGLASAPNVQPGFSLMTLAMNGTNFNGVNLTLGSIGAAFAERNRTPAIINNPPVMTQEQIYRDFIFANNAGLGTGMSFLIERLAPNTQYGLTIWSWDSQTGVDVRTSDWIETASGTSVTITNGYSFTSPIPPTHDYDSTFGALLTSSASGKLMIEGRKSGSSTTVANVLVNAIRLVVQPIVRITNAELVNGNLRLTIETQFPGQTISIEEKTDLGTGNWLPPSSGGITETHGPIVIAEFPASANQVFYRVTAQ